MHATYSGTYIDTIGRQYPATVYLSSVTITIRMVNESGEQKDIYWLAARVARDETASFDMRLLYPGSNGGAEQLVIRDAVFQDAIKKQFSSYAFSGAGMQHRLFSSARSKILAALGIVAFVLLAAYLWVIPWLGERVALGFSTEYEKQLGDAMYLSTIAAYKIDEEKTALLNEFYQSLHYETGYPVKITVVRFDELNAFAFPGGHIIVYDEILRQMKSPEELAALLGHEASHVMKRHSLRSLFRTMARRMFVSLIFGNDAGIISFVASNADQLKNLEYSRALETEADDSGMKLMAANHIDPAGMLHLMQLLQSSTHTGSGEPVSFLSTHPVFKDRIEHIRHTIALYPAGLSTPPTLAALFRQMQSGWL